MNIFNVLGVNYEVFHSRMLAWLWDHAGDHGAGNAYWLPICEILGLNDMVTFRIDSEAAVAVPNANRRRRADLLMRSRDELVLVENKVDPLYQDVQQVRDEIAAGKHLAQAEGRRFIFLLIAPGPLSIEMRQVMAAPECQFVRWHDLKTWMQQTTTDKTTPFAAEIIRQYLEFLDATNKTDELLASTERAIQMLASGIDIGVPVTAVELWQEFCSRHPDELAALDSRWADSSHYSAKAWFASKLQRLASTRELLEDTGEWSHDVPSDWGYNKVRVYRRVASGA